jgi:hypothetical protein
LKPDNSSNVPQGNKRFSKGDREILDVLRSMQKTLADMRGDFSDFKAEHEEDMNQTNQKLDFLRRKKAWISTESGGVF